MSVPWVPRSHQLKAVEFMISSGAGGLLLDPGLGKTSIALAAIKILKKRGFINRALVVAPLRPAQLVWPAELEKWDDFNDLNMAVLHSSFGKIDELAYVDADIFVINPEGLQWFVDNDIQSITGVDMLIVDESTKFKHANTKRFQLLSEILPKFKRRYILTGSPMPNGYLDLFGQLYILDYGRALGNFITHYRGTYFSPAGYGWELNEGAELQIQKRIKPLALRMAAEDYLDLPALVKNNIYVDIPSSGYKFYESMENELFALLDSGERIEAVNVAASLVKCRQIANGSLYFVDEINKKRGVREIHQAKLDALEALVDELMGEPVLIGYQFEHDLESLRARFGKDIPVIGKGVPLAKLFKIVADWNAGKLKWLFGHPAAIAHGLNLQGFGHHVAFFGLTWNYEDYEQFIARVFRQGNKHAHVFVHHFISRNTIEMPMVKALEKKHKTQKEFLDALKEYRGTKNSKSTKLQNNSTQKLYSAADSRYAGFVPNEQQIKKENNMSETTKVAKAVKAVKKAVKKVAAKKAAVKVDVEKRVSKKIFIAKQYKADAAEALPAQAQGILKVLKQRGGKLGHAALVKALSDTITTTQPVERILSFYQPRLVNEGFITVVKEKSA